MILRIATTVLFLACNGSAWALLDLTPTPAEHTASGIKHQQLKFKDDKRTVAMDLPRGWTYRGGPTRLQLMPPSETSFAEGMIEVVPLPAQPAGAEPPQVQPLDPAAMQALEQQALTSAPPASQFVKVISKDEGVAFRDKKIFTVLISYQTLGATFRSSTAIVNFPDFRMILRVTAKQEDFESISDDFYRSALSLTWE